jgi:hypothetical protein
MRYQKCLVTALAVLGVLWGCSSESKAQQVRYMDSSGNIHFVDSLSEVPPRYREQVVPPTPTPVLDRKGLQAKKRAEMQAARERQMQERQRKVEERRRQREQELAALKEKRRLQRERNDSSFLRE